MDQNALLQIGPFQTSYPEFIAVIFGLTCVWFMKKESTLAFPFGIVNVLIYVYIFFTAGLYANAAINAFFFVMSVYGWYKWTHKGSDDSMLQISRCRRRELLLNLLAAAVLFFIIRQVLLSMTESSVPTWDAATTAVYIVAQWMLSHKKIENWLLWIAADSVMVVLCAWQGLWFTSFQYLVFTVIAVLGFFEWRTKLSRA
jgi:nicotinamide mononucleotide transporter